MNITNDINIYKKNIIIHENMSPYLTELITSDTNSELIFCKSYYVSHKSQSEQLFYVINIKKINKKLYLYVLNFNTNKNTLIHIFEPCDNIKYLNKYIQISSDTKVLSIPDGNFLYVYDVDLLIKNSELIETCFILQLDNFIDFNLDRCVLYRNKIIFVGNEIDKLSQPSQQIITYNFSKPKHKTINIELSNSKFVLSANGNFTLIYNNKIANIVGNISDTNKNILLNDMSNMSNISNIATALLSSDGNMAIFLTYDKTLKIYFSDCLDSVKLNLKSNVGNLKNIKTNIYDFSNFLPKLKTFSQLHILTLFDKSINKLYIWSLLIYCNNEVLLMGPKEIKFEIKPQIESLNINNNVFVYKYKNLAEIYDINKYFPEILLNTMLDNIEILIRNTMSLKNNLKIITANGEIEIKNTHWITEIINGDLNLQDFNGVEYDILTHENKRIPTLDIFLIIFHDHYKINEIIKELANEVGQRKKLNIVLDLILVMKEKINKIHAELNIVCAETNYYFEYLIIKVILIYYKNKQMSNLHNIQNIIKYFNKLKGTRMAVINICKIIFGLELCDYICN